MEHSARIFNCARCHRQVIICSCCDHGNIYCSYKCSLLSRQESLRAAGKRYQNTYQGKTNHARRQRRYRDQEKKKVTHHSSPEINNNDLLQTEESEYVDYDDYVDLAHNNDIHCDFCGYKCNSSLRIAFLVRNRPPITTSIPGVWPLGP